MGQAFGGAMRNGRPEETSHLRDLWNFVLRNRLLTFGFPVLIVAATVVFVQLATPVYDAATSIRIDEKRSNLPVLDALSTLSGGSQINTEIAVLRSRSLAEDVLDSLGLQLIMTRPRRVARAEVFASVQVERSAPEAEYRFRRHADGQFRITGRRRSELGAARIGEPVRLPGVVVTLSPGAAEHEEIRIKVREYPDALRAFRRALAVSRPDREADLLVARYEATDSVLVHKVPNALATLFMSRRETARKAEAVSTARFLTEQIDTLAAQLLAAEEDLRDFREGRNVVALEAEARAQVTRLAEFQAERDRIDAEREALANLLAEVDQAEDGIPGEPSPFRRLMGFPSLLKNFAVSELFRSLADADRQRALLLSRRTLEDPDVQAATAQIGEIENQLRQVALTYVQGLSNQVVSLDSTLSRFQYELGRIPAKEIQFARLERQAEVLEEIYMMLQTRLKETQIVAAVEDASVRVVDPAIAPHKPIRPQKVLSLVLAVVLGLVLGGGVAFAREHFDDALHTREELLELTSGVPVLGTIPRIRDAAGNGRAAAMPVPGRAAVPAPELQSRLVAGRDPRSPISEAYRSLRTNISFSRPEQAPTSLVFTSPTPGDGKSTSAANLAITLAQQGVRCLLIDADMRRGLLQEIFGVHREPGLSNLLMGRVELEQAVQRLDLGESGRLDFLATGTLPPNPAELLGSTRMHALLDRLRNDYDAVILDAPPLNLVTDAALLGTNADGVILVARAGITERGAIAYAMEQLSAVRAPLLGSVLNDVDTRKDRYYGTYSAGAYASYYGAPAEEG